MQGQADQKENAGKTCLVLPVMAEREMTAAYKYTVAPTRRQHLGEINYSAGTGTNVY